MIGLAGLVGRVSGWMTAWSALLCLQAGCSKTETLTCAASIADACGGGTNCVSTWDEARIDTAICARSVPTPPLRAACGGYHVITIALVDANRSDYYDAATGRLVAVVIANGSNGTTTCVAGPAGGFTLPTCTGAISEPLPQCLLDGGADAITPGDGPAD